MAVNVLRQHRFFAVSFIIGFRYSICESHCGRMSGRRYASLTVERKHILVSEYYNCELSADFRRRGRGGCGIQGKLKSLGDNRNTEPDRTDPTTKEGTGQGDSHEKGSQRDASSFKKYRDTDKLMYRYYLWSKITQVTH